MGGHRSWHGRCRRKERCQERVGGSGKAGLTFPEVVQNVRMIAIRKRRLKQKEKQERKGEEK
jgi:hypothetical protein